MINRDVRRRAEEALGLEGKVPEPMWTYLTQKGAVAAVEKGEQDINWLTDEVWKLLDASGRRRQLLEGPRMLSLGQRERAKSREAVLAILCWDEARRDRAVCEFRIEVLNRKLLAPGEVEGWMTRQAASDGPPTVWLRDLPVPGGIEVVQDRGRRAMFTKPSLVVSSKYPARSGELRYLACMPGIAFPTAKDGVLERVRHMSQTLAQRFSWNPLQATLFLLTDEIPVVPAIRVTPEVSRIPACTRLIMDIDPMAAPQAIVESFRRARRELFSRRLRSLSVKHLRLAAFIAQQGLDGDWASSREEWNKKHRQWAYLRLNIFKRDCQRARARVLGLGSQVREFRTVVRPSVQEQRSLESRPSTVRLRPARTKEERPRRERHL